MKEYPNQIPSQRQRTGAGNLRTPAVNPPRRVTESVTRPQTATRQDTVTRPQAATRQDTVTRPQTATRQDTVTRPQAATRQDTVTRPQAATRQDTVTRPQAATRQDTVTRPQAATRQESVTCPQAATRPSSTRTASPRRPDSERRRRTRSRGSRKHPLHAILTASAAMYLALFLIPFLFTSDTVSGAASLSGPLKRSPDAAVKAASETAQTESVAEAESVPETESVAEADTLAQVSETDSLAQIAAPDFLPSDAPDADAPEPEPFSGQLDEDCFLRVLNRKDDEVSVMSMQEYLVCVLRGEMPGYFEPEALKAQAVAARTYTRYMLHSGSKHGERADICTSPACCQAYLSAAAARQKWGYLPEDEEQKIRAAVIDTDGETMLYDGEPILAVFHASSSGLTRTSGDVWSGDKPYLQPVPSPENADNTPNYYSHVEFTLARLRDKLSDAFPKANLSGDVSEWLSDAERDAAGNIITMYVGGIKTQGSRVRSALGLRSACFTWEYGDGKVEFYVTGYGHGVGLSQYGANQMARDGADYRAILTHYYTGVRIGGYWPS